MAERSFIFRGGSDELALPVTPDSYSVAKGINVEVVNIHQLGDAIVAGYGTLATVTVNCLLPANNYHFAAGGDPEYYLERLHGWVESKTRLRFVVSDTGVNLPVLLQEVSHGEQDGTNDVYAKITMREYRNLEAVQVAVTATDNAPRAAVEQEPAMQTHVLQYGETLSGLCRKYYGDGTEKVWSAVAAYNGIKNPHLFPVGTVIKFPKPLP